MDLQSIECFAIAATTLNFRAAARKVALSPGAFSDRIRRLEDELGTPLFERTTRRAVLTEAGRRLLPEARALLLQAARCREVASGADIVPYELTVGTRFELGMSWLCPALEPLRRARPERTLHMFMGDTPDLMARVERGDIDAVVFSARLTSPNIEYTTLHSEEYLFVGTTQAIDGPESAREHVLLDVSADLPLFRYLLDALPEGPRWRFARHEYLGGIGAIRYRVREGAGVAVLPEYFVRDDLRDGTLRRLMPEVTLQTDAFRLVWRSRHPQEEHILALAEDLRARPLR
jgi:DNA-binding transcriptional LysR family regulator